MKLAWSAAALADLDRFTAFLHERHPRLAKIICRADQGQDSLAECVAAVDTATHI